VDVTQIIGTKYELGLPDVQRERRAIQALAQQVPAEEGGDPAWPGDDLQDGGQDLVLQHGQHLRRAARVGRLPVRAVRACLGVRAAGGDHCLPAQVVVPHAQSPARAARPGATGGSPSPAR
jgi:hypothetical protein